MQPYPRSPDLVWPGHLHGTGCLSARAVGTGFPTVGLRLCLGPGCGWSWVLLTPARRGWGLGWVCLGSVCGVVPLLPAVCGVRGWALVSACFQVVCGFVHVSLAPRRFRFRRAVWACVLGPGLGCAPPFLAGLSGCVFCAFFFPVAGCPCPGPCGLSPRLLSFGLGCWLFFFFFFGVCLLVTVPLFLLGRCSWLGVAGFGWVVPPCLFGALSSVPSGWGVWPPSVLLAGCLVAVGCFRAAPPCPPSLPLFFGGGGGGRPGRSPLWLPSAGACSVAGVWCGWSLATPGGGSCVLLPATPGWVSLPVVVGGPRHSWLGSAGGGGVWCVVCGGGVLVGLWLVCGVVGPSPLLAEVPVCYSPQLLAGFRCRWWWAVPATPGWGPLAAVVCGVWCVVVVCWWGCGWCVVWLVPRHSWRRFLCATPRHSWLGIAAAGAGRSPPLLAGVRLRRCCVVCGVWRWCVGGVVAGVWCAWSLATPGGGFCVLLPATPGWVSLPLVVGGPRHSWLGSAGGGGVWCVAVVCCWGCGWCVVWLVPRHSWRRSLCATPRHSWLGFAAGGGERSPPLLAGVRWRRWCVVCGVLVGSLATPGGGSRVLLPATPGWGPLAAVVCGVWCVGGVPRHSWRRTRVLRSVIRAAWPDREPTWPAFLEGGVVLRITDADANNWLPPALRSALAHWRYRRHNPPPPQPQPPHKRRRR